MLLIWSSLTWLIVFGVVNKFLIKNKRRYNDNFLIISLFFGIIFSLALYFFYKDIFFLLPKFKIEFVIYGIVFFISVIALWVVAKKFGEEPKWEWLEHNRLFSFDLNSRVLISRLFDILFQQIILLGIISFFMQDGLVGVSVILASALLFSSLHIPVLFFVDDYPIIFLSFIGALIFGFLIINFKNGLVYSILIHWGFYYIIPPLSWLFNKE